MARQGVWIDVYPFNERNLLISSTDKRIQFSKELSDFANTLPRPKFDAWIPFMSELSFDNTSAYAKTGVAQYKLVKGMTEALAKKLPFAPLDLGYSPCLSAGFLTSTTDSKILLQRRPNGVHCPRVFIHEPCGYIGSGYITPRPKNPADEKHAQNPRLYDIVHQLHRRRLEIADIFGLPVESVSCNHLQHFFAADWRCVEAYFSTIGKIDATENNFPKDKNAESIFMPFENLKDLIYAQGKLSQVNPVGYNPKNTTDLPLLGETTSGLIWGYEELTGEKLDIEETIERLNHEGLSINVYDTKPGRIYKFPTKF